MLSQYGHGVAAKHSLPWRLAYRHIDRARRSEPELSIDIIEMTSRETRGAQSLTRFSFSMAGKVYCATLYPRHIERVLPPFSTDT